MSAAHEVETAQSTRAGHKRRACRGPVDIAFDAKGRLLALEMGRFDLASATFGPGTGRLSRLDLVRGRREVLLEGLSRPVTVVPVADGAYVIVQSSGAILRLEANP